MNAERPSDADAGPRIAVVGVGARSVIAQHVGAAFDGARVVAAVDPSPQGRGRAEALFPGVLVFGGVTDLLAAEAVDAAIVTSPATAGDAI